MLLVGKRQMSICCCHWFSLFIGSNLLKFSEIKTFELFILKIARFHHHSTVINNNLPGTSISVLLSPAIPIWKINLPGYPTLLSLVTFTTLAEPELGSE